MKNYIAIGLIVFGAFAFIGAVLSPPESFTAPLMTRLILPSILIGIGAFLKVKANQEKDSDLY